MKIVINETSKIEEVSAKVASRLINKGKAHYPEKQKGNIILSKKIPKLNNDLIIPLKVKKKLKEFSAELKTSEAISEPLEGVEVKLGEIGELAEPIKKPKRRYRKKKSKFKDWEFD